MSELLIRSPVKKANMMASSEGRMSIHLAVYPEENVSLSI